MTTQKHFDVVTIGGAMRDFTCFTKDGVILKKEQAHALLAFPYGSKLSFTSLFMTLGGGACNTAVIFRKLGFVVGIITSLGDDVHGKAILNELKREDIDTSAVSRTPKEKTGMSFIIATEQTKEHVVFAYPGAIDLLTLNASVLSQIHTPWWYLTSLGGPKHHWLANLRTLFRIVQKKKQRIAWNPGKKQIREGLQTLRPFLWRTTVFALNMEEAKDFVASFTPRLVDYLKGKTQTKQSQYLAEKIKATGPQRVVITDGSRGAYAFDGKHFLFRRATPTKPHDTTGAGDAFNASFVAGQIYCPHAENIGLSLELGTMNADAQIRRVGAQEGLLQWKEIVPRLRKNFRDHLRTCGRR